MQSKYGGLWRDTWWLWLAFCALALFMSWRVHPVFLATIPGLVVVFAYYANMRYHADGTHKNPDEDLHG